MRGLQLQQERLKRRTELRRIASDRGYTAGAFLALDQVELLQRADLGDGGARGNAVKRRLILMGLASASVASATAAAAWAIQPAMLDELTRVPLLDRAGLAGAIDMQVLEELPETAEPGRVQEPAASIDARNDRRWARVD